VETGYRRYAGKRSVIVGAASGVGRATLLRLADEGAEVIGVDVDAAGLGETLAKAGGGRAIVCDVTRQADVEQLAGLGRVDVLAYTAGVMDGFVPAGEMTDELWDRVLDVNVTGAMRVIRAVLPQMTQGTVVAVGSIAAQSAGAAGTAYSVSKHALVGLVRSVAFFYGRKGIRANVVCPGLIATPMAEQPIDRESWAFQRALPTIEARCERPASAEEVAALVTWLGSDESAAVNGAVVTADGGWTLA
jgi:NAD(P)-dependent dehydrogenase (short-subunit alcohol dehydrogenase family)